MSGPKPFAEREWAQAGKALLCCSGLACLGLALHHGHGPIDILLRTWVGLLGVALSMFSLLRSRK